MTAYNNTTNEQLTTSRAAEFLGISPTQLRNLEAEGKIYSERSSNGYRYFEIPQLVKLKQLLEARKAEKKNKIDSENNEEIISYINKDNNPNFKQVANLYEKHDLFSINIAQEQEQNTTPKYYDISKDLNNKKPKKKFYKIKATAITIISVLCFHLLINKNIDYIDYIDTSFISNKLQPAVLQAATIAREWRINFNAPSFFSQNVQMSENLEVQGTLTTTSLNFTENGAINQLASIDDTTRATLETALQLAGDITSAGLANVTINENTIGDLELEDTINYTGALTVSGSLSINGNLVLNSTQGNEGDVLTLDADGNAVWVESTTLDANSIQGVTIEQFLRSDEDTAFDGGTLTINNNNLLDLSLITHQNNTLQGLRLPQGINFTNPAQGEGYLAYDTTLDVLKIYNGSAWVNVVDVYPITETTVFNGDITGTFDTLVINPGAVTSSKIANNTITADNLASNITFTDGDLLNLSQINISSTQEGIILPQTTNCTLGTAVGQMCWDTQDNVLYIGNGTGLTLVGGAITGNISTIRAGDGLVGGGDIVSTSLDVVGGNGIVANPNSVEIDLLANLDGVGQSSSFSGLEFSGALGDKLSLLQGCSDKNFLLWNASLGVWECGTITQANGVIQAYQTIQNSNANLQQRTVLNFLGAGITAYDANSKTNIELNENLNDIAELTPGLNFLVGNGLKWSTANSTTVKSSLGLGTTDSPTFANLNLTSGFNLSTNVKPTNNLVNITAIPLTSGGILPEVYRAGLYLGQSSANGVVGLKNGIVIENLNATLEMLNGINIVSESGEIRTGINVSNENLTNAIDIGSNYILATGSNMRQYANNNAWYFESTQGDEIMTINYDSDSNNGSLALGNNVDLNVETITSDTFLKLDSNNIQMGALENNNLYVRNSVVDQPNNIEHMGLFWRDPASSEQLSNDAGIILNKDGKLTYKNEGTGDWTEFDSLGGFTTDGTYIYPTQGQFLGNNASGGANKLNGIYLGNSSPLVFGANNNVSLSFASNALNFNLGNNDVNFDSNTLYINGSSNKVAIGTTSTNALLNIFGTTEQLRLSYNADNYVSFDVDAVGDLFVNSDGINIAQFGETQINFNVPTSFNVPGDASFGYDMILTNKNIANIKSFGPLAIDVGESFENSTLTLKTYGTGQLFVDASGGSIFTTDDITTASFNRLTSDGTIISFKQDSVEEGTITISENTVSYNAFTGSHYAWLNETETLEKGKLVTLTGENKYFNDNPNSEIIYGVTESTIENDPKILGAYLSIQESKSPASTSNPHLIMAVGNGDMWVIDKGENIVAGDNLISSEIKGHAQKDSTTFEKSYIIATAAENVDWTKIDQTFNGVKHAKISVTFSKFTITRLANGLVKIDKDNEIKYTTEEIDDFINSTNKNNEDTNTNITSIEDRLNILETESTQTTGLIAQMQEIFEEFKQFIEDLGLKATKSVDGTNMLSVQNDFNVLGNTTLNNVDVIGTLNVGFVKLDSIEQSLNILGPSCYNKDTKNMLEELCEAQTLYLQKNLAGSIDIFDGTIKITPEGNINTQGDIKAKSINTSNITLKDDIVGSSTLPANEIVIKIDTTKVEENSLIFITPTSNLNGQNLYLKSKEEKIGFEVALESSLSEDVNFNWFILNKDNE